MISKRKFQEKLENGVPTKISFLGGKLRDKPSYLGNVIYELEKGDEILVYDWFNNPYFKASYKGSIGYISYGSLQKNKHIQTVINEMKQDKFEKLKEENPRFARLKKEYGESTAKRLTNGEIWIGMSDEMAREALGYPNDINRSTGTWGVHEQWVYSNETYLYFENGKLTSWQDG